MNQNISCLVFEIQQDKIMLFYYKINSNSVILLNF